MDGVLPATRSAAEKAYRKVRSANVTVGNFFFQYRNYLFPVVFVVAAVTLRPSIMFGSPLADRLIGACGMVIVLLGEAVRLVTIGFEYIDRGGKEGRVYAGRLVQGGVFGLVRNPMYIGNVLIAVGMTMFLRSPLGYIILIPLFLFLYQSLIAAEETYLRDRFASITKIIAQTLVALSLGWIAFRRRSQACALIGGVVSGKIWARLSDWPWG
jgi:protein-S-isoprenylcysteine O-methyltransferase Ste14